MAGNFILARLVYSENFLYGHLSEKIDGVRQTDGKLFPLLLDSRRRLKRKTLVRTANLDHDCQITENRCIGTIILIARS